MYFVPSRPAAVRNKIHVSIGVSWEKGQGIQTFRKQFSVRLNLCEKTSPVLSATERPFGKVRETRLAERWDAAAKKPQHGLQNRRGCWPCDSDLSVTSVLSNPCTFPLPVDTSELSADLGPALGCWLPPRSHSRHPKQGNVHRCEGECGLVLFGAIRTLSPHPQKPQNTHLNHLSSVSTDWLLHTYSHSALGNQTASNLGLQTPFFGFRNQLISLWNDFVLLSVPSISFSHFRCCAFSEGFKEVTAEGRHATAGAFVGRSEDLGICTR